MPYLSGCKTPTLFLHSTDDHTCCVEQTKELDVYKRQAYGRKEDAASQAHALFAALRELDRRGARTVYARCPREDGVALAVYNRILRAAAFRVVEA